MNQADDVVTSNKPAATNGTVRPHDARPLIDARRGVIGADKHGAHRLCGELLDRAEAKEIRVPPHEWIELTCGRCNTEVLGVLIDERW